MAVRVLRLGARRSAGEGLRIGTVRRVPRGVRREDWARRDWFDVWLPDLAPSQPLVTWALSRPWTERRWARYAAAYRREMRAPAAARLLDLLARLSHQTAFSVGCYCEDAARCHRSILRALLAQHGAVLAD